MTEKDYNPQQKEKKAMEKQKNVNKVDTPKVVEPVKKVEIVKPILEDKVEKTKPTLEEQNIPEKKEIADANTNPHSDLHKEQNIPEKKEKKKEVEKTKPKVKRTEAIVNATSLPISTKDSAAICKFITKKKISQAIKDLEQVHRKERAVPMKGEIPHRKGKGMSSGRFATKAVGHFITLLKTLVANANVNELDDPRITEAIANMASKPYGRFGRMKRKRTHVKIIAKDYAHKKIADAKPVEEKK